MGALTHTETRTVRGATPDQAFAFVADVDNMHKWVEATSAATAEGEPGVGRIIHTTAPFMGREFKIKQFVDEWDPPRRYALSGTRPLPMGFDFTFEAAGSDTKMTLRISLDPKGVPGGTLVIKPLIKKQAAKVADAVARQVAG